MLKDKYPGIKIIVLASKSNACIVKTSPDIDCLLIYEKSFGGIISLVRRLIRMKFDFIVNLVLYSSLTGGILTSIAAGKSGYRVRMTQGDDKDRFYHLNIRKTVWGGAVKTMLEETSDIINKIGVDFSPHDVKPIIHLPENLMAEAANWRKSLKPEMVAGVNIAAGVLQREVKAFLWKIILEKLVDNFPSVQFVIFAPLDSNALIELKKVGYPDKIMINPPHKGFLGAAALIGCVDIVISSDTSTPHLCSGLGIPVITLYHCKENSILWEPYSVSHEIVISPTGNNDGHEPDKVIEAFKSLIQRTKGNNFLS